MFQCQRCGNMVPDGYANCPVCGMQYQVQSRETPERLKVLYSFGAKIDTYGLLWSIIGKLQIILILVYFTVFIILNASISGLSFHGSEGDILILNIVVTLFVSWLGASNTKTGDKIMGMRKIAIAVPHEVIDELFQLKKMVKTLVFNLLISGLIGIDFSAMTVSVGLIGVIGSIYGFYVRYFALKKEYLLLPQVASPTVAPSYAPNQPQAFQQANIRR